MQGIILKRKACRNLRQGQSLIQIDDLLNEQDSLRLLEGQIVRVYDQQHQLLGLMLVGRQQKGLGWLLSRQAQLEEDWFEQRLELALEQRAAFFADPTLTAFRLVNGEGDGLGGLTMDWYAGFIQINWYSQGIAAYCQRTLSVLEKRFPDLRGVYETHRFETEHSPIRHTWGQEAPHPLVILENGVSYAIHLGQEWMTGLFLDQRQVRDYLRLASANQRVLNLFSYTGGFSVAAALGGASHTVSVDVANRSLSKTQENFALNEIQTPSDQHEIRVMDVFDYIRYAKRNHLSFDWVVCDPPSFARTKKYRFSALRQYGELAADLWDLVVPGGALILSTNHAAYPLAKFQEDCLQACPGGRLIQQFGLGQDFPTSSDMTSSYLKVLILQKDLDSSVGK